MFEYECNSFFSVVCTGAFKLSSYIQLRKTFFLSLCLIVILKESSNIMRLLHPSILLFIFYIVSPNNFPQYSQLSPILKQYLSDCNGTRTHNHLACKRTFDQLVFVYELNGCKFESHCSHLNFRHHACFKQGVSLHSGNCRVWIHFETRT